MAQPANAPPAAAAPVVALPIVAPPLNSDFQSSYQKFDLYPENLSDPNNYLSALRAYRTRLNAAADRLFTGENVADVPFRDLGADGALLAVKNVWSDLKLRTHLGDTATVNAQTRQVVSGAFATKPDPKCRFIFLWAKHSRAPLNVTRRMLTRILSFHQVMPRYLEFLFLFGQRTNPLDLRYSGFREQTDLSAVPEPQKMLSLGRSGRRIQMCYNLKTVNNVTGTGTLLKLQDWPIRQAAIYHSLDVECGTTVWIMAKGDEELKDRVSEVTGANGRAEDKSFSTPEASFRSSLAIHSMLAHWATDSWRWYVQWLENVVDQETDGAVSGSRDPDAVRKEYTPGDLQEVQIWEEKADEAVMIIDANITVLTAIKDCYEALSKDAALLLNVRAKVVVFNAHTQEAIADLKMQSSRAKLLSEIVSQRKTLVLQHLQAQTTEKMEVLTVMSQREAIAMRIITIVTLIYLPATFVSTFFSTDIVKYQGQSGGSGTSFSPVAMSRWLQVTLPLTAITFVAAWIGYTRARRNIPLRSLAREVWSDIPLLPLCRKP